jgi:hypothetical protein
VVASGWPLSDNRQLKTVKLLEWKQDEWNGVHCAGVCCELHMFRLQHAVAFSLHTRCAQMPESLGPLAPQSLTNVVSQLFGSEASGMRLVQFEERFGDKIAYCSISTPVNKYI